MEKIWYIILNGKKEGPYSLQDLQQDVRISPDTLVWKEGFEKWVPIGKVEELKSVFEEPAEEGEEEPGEALPAEEEITLQLKEDPPSLIPLFAILIACLILFLLMKHYLDFAQFFNSSSKRDFLRLNELLRMGINTLS